MITTKPRNPVKYSGSGSAIDHYLQLQDIDSPPPAKQISENWAVFDKNNTKHMRVLSLCRQAGWVAYHATYGEVADLQRLSNWLHSSKCPVNKPLKKMCNKTEMPKVIKALSGIVKSRYK
jgi:hypothetical protein